MRKASLQRLSQFPFYLEWELEDSSLLITVLFSGTIRLFEDPDRVRAAIIFLDSFSYSSVSSDLLNKENLLSIFKEHLWAGPQSIQQFRQFHDELEVF